MPQVEEVPVKSSLTTKLIVGIIVAFVFLSGLIFALAKYYRLTGRTAYEIANESKQQTESVQQFEREYKEEFMNKISSYLSSVNPDNPFTLGITGQTQTLRDELIAMRVPAVYTDYHLSAVLILNKIEVSVQDQDPIAFKDNIDQLTEIISKL